MRYLTEINAFERMMDRQPLPALAQLLWYKLMREANRQRWPETFSLDNKTATALIGVTIHAFTSARKSLEAAGLLQFKQGVKGRPSTYRLIPPTELDALAGVRYGAEAPEGVPGYLSDGVEDLTLYFGWNEDVGKELARVTREIFASYWPDHSPDDRDRQRVFECIKEQSTSEDGETVLTLSRDRKELLAYAFEQASRAGAVNWNYIYGVLRNLEARGIHNTQQAWEYDEERSRRNGWS